MVSREHVINKYRIFCPVYDTTLVQFGTTVHDVIQNATIYQYTKLQPVLEVFFNVISI